VLCGLTGAFNAWRTAQVLQGLSSLFALLSPTFKARLPKVCGAHNNIGETLLFVLVCRHVLWLAVHSTMRAHGS